MIRIGHLGIVAAVALVGGLLVGANAEADNSGRFIDDDGSIFEADIEAFAAAGLTQGCNPPLNDRFCPDDYVTRAQMATFLARLLELIDGGGGDLFTDDDASVHRNNIDQLATAGITYGCNPPDNDLFCPDTDVTRGQMSAFLVRALLLPPGGSVAFSDDDKSIFEDDIEALAAAGITLGCNPPDNTQYCPASRVTRGQMAAFIMRALRRDPLLVAARQPFVDDPHRDVETELDRQPFQKINEMSCSKLLDKLGWVVEARTGGRPFMTMNSLSVDGQPQTIDRCAPGRSGIAPATINAHYDAGKGVNRLWIGHEADVGSFPTVVVVTSDGFVNISGADAPMLAGGAFRLAFIGQPFDSDFDYAVHIDELNLAVVDGTTLRVSCNVHSEIGEGSIDIDVIWDDASSTARLEVDARSAVRSRAQVGFAGVDLMRGPTLHGIVADGRMDGIEAFHDGRTGFIVSANGFDREWLVPPMVPDVVERSNHGLVVPGTAIIVDQPQGVSGYFSKNPGTLYQDRADLILEYIATNRPPVSIHRAQVAVDLGNANPEANETLNLFFATESYPGPVFEHSYAATVAADEFAETNVARPHGVLFVSGDLEGERLKFQELDQDLRPVGDPVPLTDGVIVDPHSPRASNDGRAVLFDADDYGAGTGLQRIYELDLTTAAVRRLTVDPFGSSTDHLPCLSGDRTRFAFITNRAGVPEQLVIEDTAVGLAGGFGNAVADAYAADWCPVSDVIVFADAAGVHVFDVDSAITTPVHAAIGTDKPRFSPDCTMIAYEDPSGVWIVAADGTAATLTVADGRSPAWVDNAHLLLELGESGSSAIHLFDRTTDAVIGITDGVDSRQPTYVPAIPAL